MLNVLKKRSAAAHHVLGGPTPAIRDYTFTLGTAATSTCPTIPDDLINFNAETIVYWKIVSIPMG